MMMQVRSLASPSGLRIQRCRELWYRSQMCCYGCGVGWQLQLQFKPLAWELPHAVGTALKKAKNKKIKNFMEFPLWRSGNESD